MTDEFTYMRHKWRCSQCGRLNSMELDNICQACCGIAPNKDDEKKPRDAVSTTAGARQMMQFLYRFFNGRWVDRLITQHRFESIASSPEALRIIRARRAHRRPPGD